MICGEKWSAVATNIAMRVIMNEQRATPSDFSPKKIAKEKTPPKAVDDGADNTVSLFEREEAELLSIKLTDQRVLELRQFGSSDDRWGIYSSVWDGGLALLAYLAEEKPCWEELAVIDLGSGTGIVGFGVSALSKGRAIAAVTDLEEALPLLHENSGRNAHLWTFGRNVLSPRVKEVTWGKPIDVTWLKEQVLLVGGQHCPQGKCRRVLITGADIVYRRPLFLPLLSTLSELLARLHQLNPSLEVEILLACHSIRTHLNEFWEAARRENFSISMVATIQLAEDKKDIARATMKKSSESNGPPPVKKDGYVWLVKVRKRPYAFAV